MPVKYKCNICNYITNRKSSYIDHLRSKKHNKHVLERSHYNECDSNGTQTVPNGTQTVPNGTQTVPNGKPVNIYKCDYCGKILTYKKTLYRHKRSCKFKGVYNEKQIMNIKKDQLLEKLEEQNKILKKQEELENQLKLKDNELEELKEVKDDYMELLKQIAVSKTKAGKTINMYYVINNFNDAYNYEDLMKPELTDAEKDELDKLEPLSGSIYVIENRCITDMDVKKRPIHCLDTARDKYLLRTKDSWVVDHRAKKIFSKVSQHIYKHYILDPQNPNNSIDQILKNQKQLIKMEGKTSQIRLMKELNDKVYIKNVKLDTV